MLLPKEDGKLYGEEPVSPGEFEDRSEQHPDRRSSTASDNCDREPNQAPNVLVCPDDWSSEISAYVGQLKAMMRTSEEGFLSVGSQLQEVQTGTQQVSLKLGGLMADYSDEDGGNSLKELQLMSVRSTNQLNSFDEYSTKAITRLENLQSPLVSLPESLKEFDRLVSRLRKMGIVAHIEAARLGNEGLDFVRLAEAVSALGEQIAAKAKEVRVYIDAVGKVILSNKSKMEHLADKHRYVTDRVTGDMQSNLQVLNEKQELYQQTTSGISAKSEEAVRNINVVVQSVQYHDITRQQVDHILEALESVREEDSAVDIIPIFEIQVAQLKRVGREFEQAILSITTALGDLSSAVTMMLSESEQMTNFTKDSGSTFFEQVERGLEFLTATMAEDRYAVRDLTSSLRQISEHVRKMKSFMDEMVDVGSEIELLALNSRVKAAKTGKAGVTLGVIAESIQMLSSDTLKEVGEVIRQMSDMVAASSDLTDDRAIEDMLQRAESETNEIIGKLTDAVRAFHASNETSNKVFLETESVCEMVYAQLEELASRIGQHGSLGESLVETGLLLEKLVQRLRASVPDSAQAIIDLRLEEIRKNYTMETERSTHFAVLQGKITDDGLQADGGGSIELF